MRLPQGKCTQRFKWKNGRTLDSLGFGSRCVEPGHKTRTFQKTFPWRISDHYDHFIRIFRYTNKCILLLETFASYQSGITWVGEKEYSVPYQSKAFANAQLLLRDILLDCGLCVTVSTPSHRRHENTDDSVRRSRKSVHDFFYQSAITGTTRRTIPDFAKWGNISSSTTWKSIWSTADSKCVPYVHSNQMRGKTLRKFSCPINVVIRSCLHSVPAIGAVRCPELGNYGYRDQFRYLFRRWYSLSFYWAATGNNPILCCTDVKVFQTLKQASSLRGRKITFLYSRWSFQRFLAAILSNLLFTKYRNNHSPFWTNGRSMCCGNSWRRRANQIYSVLQDKVTLKVFCSDN